MKLILSGQRWALACLALCLAGPSVEILCAQGNLRFNIALLQLPQLAKAHPSIDQALEEARLVREDRRRRMSFFEAIAANDQPALLRMLEEGMDPNSELPLPVPIEFEKRFSDGVLRYYVSSEEGFTALMLATALRNHAFVKLLLQAGADPLKLTKRHKTFALWIAAKQNDIEIMRSLMGIGPTHESQAFRITIDLLSQTAFLWRNGKIVLSTPISSGRSSHPTPRGRFLVTNKYRYWKSTLYPAKMPFFLRLSCGDFGLHMGALPGYPASHGCIRLPGKSAKRLYASVPIGTLVEIR
jgi:hypothetical protein